MRINFTMYRNSLSFCFLLVIGLMLVITPATSAQEKPLTVEMDTKELALRHPLTLKVTNLQDWLKQPDNDLSKLILYIDGVAVKGLKPALIEEDKLLFDLRRTDENKDAWTTILSRKGENFLYRSVHVTVGFENGIQMPSNVKLKLIRINEFWLWIFVISCILIIVVFVLLAWLTDIIRDTGPQPDGKYPNGNSYRKTYSLARTQMAFWFFAIIIGYVFIWMMTGDLSSLTPGVVGLMGISAATGLGAAVVDSSKQSEQKNQGRVLDEKKKSDEVEVEKLNSEISALALSPGRFHSSNRVSGFCRIIPPIFQPCTAAA